MGWHRGAGRFASAVLAAGIAALVWTADTSAQGIVADLEGEVRVGGRPVAAGARVPAGEVVSTAAGARAVVHFDDDQWLLLHGSTQLRIVLFDYRLNEPAADRAVFELLRGVLRVVTGALGHRSPAALELRTDSMILGVRGTDFLVAVSDRSYVSVLQGTVTASNDAGTAVFEAGKLAMAASRVAPASSIAPEALPGAVASAFEQLGALRVGLPEALAPAGSRKPPAPTTPDAAAVEREAARRAHELKKALERAGAAKDAAAEARGNAKDAGKAKNRPK
jgi:hypothetical protein